MDRRTFGLSLLASSTMLGFYTPAEAAVYPGREWSKATPESVGMNSSKLRDAINNMGGSVMVIRQGKLVGSLGNLTTKFGLLSATKSIGSMLLGIAVAEG